MVEQENANRIIQTDVSWSAFGCGFNRPVAVVQVTASLEPSMFLLEFVRLTTMLISNTGHKEAIPCHF
jgi:hypothetical protein